jgi:DNA-binding HxlR family transcriptional regulator
VADDEIWKAPNVLDAHCPSRQALDLIADKWTMLVVKELAEGIRRHGELHRTIGGISQKMLTQTLRALERDGLVARTVYPVVPPKVEYELTSLGETLIEPLAAIALWAERHMDEIAQARRARQEGERAP